MATATLAAADPLVPQDPTAPRTRLASLDVFRGLTVAGMILVNNPGSWSAIYPPLRHAEWDGWTPTDLVFPFFLFIVGVSITFALSKRLADPDQRVGVVGKIVRRSLTILAVGWLLSRFPFYHDGQDIHNLGTVRLPDVLAWLGNGWKTLRIPGVLARIALCYLVAALIFTRTKPRGQAIIAAVILFGYWALLTQVPVPGYGKGDLRRGHDVTSYVDRVLMQDATSYVERQVERVLNVEPTGMKANHLYKADYDPEGFLSTLPAIGTVLLGILAGHWIRSGRSPAEVVAGLFVGGAGGIVAGLSWGAVFPINKALWTSSYVLLTAGLACQGLAICLWFVDVKGYRRWAGPFLVFGSNPLSAFVLAGVLAKLSSLIRITGPDGAQANVHEVVMRAIRTLPLMTPTNASLLYAIAFVAVCWIIIAGLHATGLRLRA